MNSIGLELLGPALGVAISPMPVMIVVLLLVAHNARSAVAYVTGWVLGLVMVGMLLVFVSDATLHEGDPTESRALALAAMLLGVLFLIMAAVSYAGIRRKRLVTLPTPAHVMENTTAELARAAVLSGDATAVASEPAESNLARELAKATTAPLPVDNDRPGWMRAIDKVSPLLALSVALISAFNPKNFSMVLLAVSDIHAANFGVLRGMLAYMNFVIVATISVGLPVLYWAYKRDAADATLRKAERWLAANQSYIMFGLFLALGLLAFYKGWQRLPG